MFPAIYSSIKRWNSMHIKLGLDQYKKGLLFKFEESITHVNKYIKKSQKT